MSYATLSSLIRRLTTIERLHGDLEVTNHDHDVLDIDFRTKDGHYTDEGEPDVGVIRFY